MTQPSGTYDSYDITGIREHLEDFVSNIAPWETPFLNIVGRGKADQTLFEWQKDTLPAASENAAVEGDDASNETVTATTRLTNRTQISEYALQVSGTTESLEIAGRPSELAYQIAKYGRLMRKDMETVLTANTAKNAGSSSVARRTAGVVSWLKDNVNKATDGTNPTGDGSDVRTAGTARALAETQVRDVQKQCFDAGALPTVLMLSGFNKQKLGNDFSGGATRNIDATAKRLVNAVDVYEGEFGPLEIKPNRLMPSNVAFLLDPDQWKCMYLRPFDIWDLAKTGDSIRKQMLVEYGLMSINQTANGIIADLTTS